MSWGQLQRLVGRPQRPQARRQAEPWCPLFEQVGPSPLPVRCVCIGLDGRKPLSAHDQSVTERIVDIAARSFIEGTVPRQITSRKFEVEVDLEEGVDLLKEPRVGVLAEKTQLEPTISATLDRQLINVAVQFVGIEARTPNTT